MLVGIGLLNLDSGLPEGQIPISNSPVSSGAHNRIRTDDLALTKGVLCQLSYVGEATFRVLSRLGGATLFPVLP